MADWPYNTTTWRKLRFAKLAASPLCEACRMRGRFTDAKAVDHIQPVKQGGDPFPPLSGLMAMCERCHNEKTSGHDRQTSVTGRRFKGFDAKGNPIDPADAWHGGPEHHEKHRDVRPTAPSGKDLLNANRSQKWVF